MNTRYGLEPGPLKLLHPTPTRALFAVLRILSIERLHYVKLMVNRIALCDIACFDILLTMKRMSTTRSVKMLRMIIGLVIINGRYNDNVGRNIFGFDDA